MSAIAKFFVHLLGKGAGGLKWERGEVGEESGERSSRGRKVGMHEKIVPKRNRFDIWRRPLGDTAPVSYFLESGFDYWIADC